MIRTKYHKRHAMGPMHSPHLVIACLDGVVNIIWDVLIIFHKDFVFNKGLVVCWCLYFLGAPSHLGKEEDQRHQEVVRIPARLHEDRAGGGKLISNFHPTLISLIFSVYLIHMSHCILIARKDKCSCLK